MTQAQSGDMEDSTQVRNSDFSTFMTQVQSGDSEDPTQVRNSDFSTFMTQVQSGDSEDPTEDHEVAIVMVPFPAQGHLNQLLQLACLISSSYHLPVYYVGSATHNRQARVRANTLNPSDMVKIHFHDIPTPKFASPPPDYNALSKFPSHLQPSWEASMLLHESIASFLRDISSKARRVVVVHDSSMSYNVQDVSSLHNAETNEMRKRAADLSNAIKKSVMDGGINRAEIDSFIAHITR